MRAAITVRINGTFWLHFADSIFVATFSLGSVVYVDVLYGLLQSPTSGFNTVNSLQYALKVEMYLMFYYSLDLKEHYTMKTIHG